MQLAFLTVFPDVRHGLPIIEGRFSASQRFLMELGLPRPQAMDVLRNDDRGKNLFSSHGPPHFHQDESECGLARRLSMR